MSDGPHITSMEHFESIPHAEIYTKAQQINPAEIASGSLAWAEIARTLATGFGDAAAILDASLARDDDNDDPADLDPGQRCARRMAAAAAEFATAMESIAARLATIAASGEALKLAVVPPNDPMPVAITASLRSGAALMDSQQTDEALRREAVFAMNMVYAPCYRPAGVDLPRFPTL
jgi:hypothetical protein